MDDGWFAEITAAVQRCVGEITFLDGRRRLAVVEHHLAALPAPTTVAEHLLLRAVVLELMLRLGQQINRSPCPSGGSLASLTSPLGPLLSGFRLPDSVGAVASCLAWARAVAADLDRRHPPSVAERAADWIDQHDAEPFDPTRVADAAHASPGHLARQFKAMFGLTMRRYHQCRRINRAIQLLAEPSAKVSVCARAAGYRSAKAFYRAFREVTGTTPRQLGAVLRRAGPRGPVVWDCEQCRWRARCTVLAQSSSHAA